MVWRRAKIYPIDAGVNEHSRPRCKMLFFDQNVLFCLVAINEFGGHHVEWMAGEKPLSWRILSKVFRKKLLWRSREEPLFWQAQGV